MPIPIDELKANVARGAKRLDTVKKDWPTKLDRQKFNIIDPHSDVLALVFGTTYHKGLRELKLTEDAAIDHGFNLPDNCFNDASARKVIEEAWCEEANKRIQKKK